MRATATLAIVALLVLSGTAAAVDFGAAQKTGLNSKPAVDGDPVPPHQKVGFSGVEESTRKCNRVVAGGSKSSPTPTWKNTWKNAEGDQKFLCLKRVRSLSKYTYQKPENVLKKGKYRYFAATPKWYRTLTHTPRKANSTIYRFNTDSGNLTKVRNLSSLYIGGAIKGETLYVLTKGGYLFGLDVTTGERLWKINIRKRFDVSKESLKNWNTVVNLQAGKNRLLFDLPNRGHALISADGEVLKWYQPEYDGVLLGENRSKGTITVLGKESIKRLRWKTGDIVWKNTDISLQAQRVQKPTESGFTIYRQEGKMHFIDWKTGETIRQFPAEKWCKYDFEGKTKNGNYAFYFIKPEYLSQCGEVKEGGPNTGAAIPVDKIAIRVYSPDGEIVSEHIYESTAYQDKLDSLGVSPPNIAYTWSLESDKGRFSFTLNSGYKLQTIPNSLYGGQGIRVHNPDGKMVYNKTFEDSSYFYLLGNNKSVYAISGFEEERITHLYEVSVRTNTPPTIGDVTDQVTIKPDAGSVTKFNLNVSDAEGPGKPDIKWRLKTASGRVIKGEGEQVSAVIRNTGKATLQVTATDPLGKQAKKSFKIDVVEKTTSKTTSKAQKEEQNSGQIPGFGISTISIALILFLMAASSVTHNRREK